MNELSHHQRKGAPRGCSSDNMKANKARLCKAIKSPVICKTSIWINVFSKPIWSKCFQQFDPQPQVSSAQSAENSIEGNIKIPNQKLCNCDSQTVCFEWRQTVRGHWEWPVVWLSSWGIFMKRESRLERKIILEQKKKRSKKKLQGWKRDRERGGGGVRSETKWD